jgi:HEAT repeat protein
VNRLNQLLNVYQKEWPRILVAWSLTFLTRVGFIVGWTILIASFLSRVGIQLLPFLFLGNAFFVMIGTLCYRHIIHKVQREVLITYTSIAGAAFLIATASFMQYENNLFFFFFLFAQGVFIGQLSILISLFNEELFSPLEGQRIFPIIESAETIGGIIAGIVLSFFSHSLPPYKFLLLGVLLLLAVLPIVLRYNARTLELPHLAPEVVHKTRPLKERLRDLKRIPFIKGLMVLVLLQWGMVNIVEFQSMKAVQQNVYEEEEETLVQVPEDQAIMLAEEDTKESDLTEKLGLLHIVFYSAALLLQLIFASRILSSLGVVPTMMLHPILTVLNVLAMSLRFNIFTASLTRGSYELTTVLFKNAIDTSVYALSQSAEEEAREIIQGLIRPIGAILGATGMLLAAFWLNSLQETLALNLLVLLGSIGMLITMKTLSKKYSELCEQNLSHKVELPTRLNSIEILGQKGHEKDFPALEKLLKRSQEPLVVKETILKTLGLREEMRSIGVILEILKDKEERLRLSALEALSQFKDLKEHLMKQAFTRHRVIEALRELLLAEESPAVREAAVQCFYGIAPEELTSFILKNIESDPHRKAAFVQMLKLFPDPNLTYYLLPCLSDPLPEVRGAAIVSLWQFEDLRGTLQHHLQQMLKSPHVSVVKIALSVAAQVRWEEVREKVHELLDHPEHSIREEALLTLAHLEDKHILPHFVDQLANPSHDWFERSGMILSSLPKKIQEEANYLLHMRFVEAIHELLSKHKKLPFEKWEKETLRYLKMLYNKLSAHKEAHYLQSILDESDRTSL